MSSKSPPGVSSFGLRASFVIRHSSFVILLYTLDQFTKWWIVNHIKFQSSHPIIPGFFDLVFFINTGAAFSAFANNNRFFIGLSIVVLVALAIFYLRGAFRGRLQSAGITILTAGILGNLTDRMVRGFVVDFLLFDLHVPFANPWPAFNVADSCICIAAGLFAIASFREGKKRTL